MAQELERIARRLAQERDLLRTRTRAVGRTTADGEFVWLEDLVSSGQKFRLLIRLPDAFPFECPRAYIVSPDVRRAPHRLVDGSLCLFADHTRGSGVMTTALVVRNRAVLWIAAYLE